MALPLGYTTQPFNSTLAYETLRHDQYVMRQHQRDAKAIQHKLAVALDERTASDLTTEAMQAARIRAARAMKGD